MKTGDRVVERIDSVFNNNDFLMSAADGKSKFDDERLYRILTITLNYFLTTRDNCTRFSVGDMESCYQRLNAKFLTDEQLDNIITNGYLTHSFNAIERKYIERYGFDYITKLSSKERKELESIRADLRTLESELGRSLYLRYRQMENEPSIVEQEVFMTFPGSKSIHYAKNAPERFYLGPVGRYSFYDFPMLVGESQKDYLMRILKYRIEHHTYNVDQDELASLAERIVEYYTKKGSCISFIGISDIIDKPIYTIHYGMCGEDNLRNFCSSIFECRNKAEYIFTHKRNDCSETMDIGNLVTLSSSIPQDSIAIAGFPNIFELKQQYLKDAGVSKGVPVRYKDCTRIDSMSDYPDAIKKYYR